MALKKNAILMVRMAAIFVAFFIPQNPTYEDQIETFPYFFRGLTIGKKS